MSKRAPPDATSSSPMPSTDRPAAPTGGPPAGTVDPLDDVLRRSMRALDEQTPAGYFEALPAAIEARIEARSEARIDARIDARSDARIDARVAPAVPEPAPSPTTVARAKRRSLAQTQLGAPIPWWQSRGAAVALGAMAVVAAVALLGIRKGATVARRSAEGMSASAGELRPASRPGSGAVAGAVTEAERAAAASPRAVESAAPGAGRPVGPVSAADPAARASEAARLRSRYSAVLPTARGCVGARQPGQQVTLAVEISASGAIAVSVRGLDEPGAVACLVSSMQSIEVGPPPGAAVKLELPLFE